MMRVISMVPSLTETLLAAERDFQVVGRTRFCIHPLEKVKNIPVVGGTKDIDWERVRSLKPDLMIFDREENPKSFAEQCPTAWTSTHVQDALSLSQGLRELSEKLNSISLMSLANRWLRVAESPVREWNFLRIPAQIEKLKYDPQIHYEKLVYVIWRNPWMAVSKETFIGSMLKKLGAGQLIPEFSQSYPEFLLENFDLRKTYFLFSSEPYPFAKKKSELLSLGLQGASLVDGEAYSWFGLRSLGFLERELSLQTSEEK
jgi:hypothetical protein